jgi:hypothetical protein
VAKAHQQRALHLVQQRELNEQRIRQLEDIEQRLINNLQSTVLSKNAAINELSRKSKSLHKVVQPRGAYKIPARNIENKSNYKSNEPWLLYKNSEDSFFHDGPKTKVMKFEFRSRSIIPESDRLDSLRI